MVYTKVLQIKTGRQLKVGVAYIINEAKTFKENKSLENGINYIINEDKTFKNEHGDTELFPMKVDANGQLVTQLISGHLINDVEHADSEFLQIKQLANIQKGRDIDYHLKRDDMVLAHHVIQSFSPEDNLTPEEIHEIGRKTILELTGGEHAFVIATHMDKEHIHNHIYFNSTNQVTLNQFRWLKNTKRNLEKISDRYADMKGAKLIDKQPPQFNHTQYLAYQKQNVFKLEIKSRLEFLLKHSTSIEDFKNKAKHLNLFVDFSGKEAKYRLLDKGQERNTRDHTLSKKGRYSLSKIEERISKNQVVLSTEEIKTAYDNLQKEKADDFEMRSIINPWQIQEQTKTGIYVEVDYGINNKGVIKIPNRYIDLLDDGRFEIFTKRKDYFYFMNPDKSTQNKFIRGDTLVKQLAYHNGEYVLSKNPQLSKLDQLLKEFEYLSKHNVTDGQQFIELENTFIKQIKEVENVLDKLDKTIATRHQIAAALTDYYSDNPTDRQVAIETLEKMKIPLTLTPEEIQKELTELAVERNALREKFEEITGDYEKYEEVKKHSKERETEKSI